ncbi:MAG: hypothetical protein KME11_04800 [Timaviella obliquedivisa GSE-PSE-MK23-08B]|jgi:hypothetical protein|nr:hypothetical protein [Timaviella obliquedivisa GSE-PSE-MK23-08B]
MGNQEWEQPVDQRGQPNIAQIEKHYRSQVFLGFTGFCGVMLIGRILKYPEWRQTGVSLLLLILIAAVIWGVFGYARIANSRGGYIYGHQQRLAILICAVPAAVLLLITVLSFVI